MDSLFPMHQAAVEGDLEKVKHCIEKGMSVDSLDNNNYTPLEWAAQCGHLDIVKFLICQTTDLNLKPYVGYRAVLFAAESGCKDVVDILLRCGSETNGYSGRWTVLHHSSSRGWTDTVEWILKNCTNTDLLDARTTLEMTPLMLAASEGHLSVVDLLINNGADLNCRDADSWTALHYASKRGWLEVVEFIADVGGCDFQAKNSSGKTPLDIAWGMNHSKISQELLRVGAIFAAASGDVKGMKYLLEHGLCIDTCDYNGCTPLHFAAEHNQLKVVRFLISNNCNLNSKDNNGETAMLMASWYNRKEIIDLLIESGADVTCCNEHTKITILHQVSEKDWTDTMRCILEKENVDVNVKDECERTPLHYAASHRRLNTTKLLLQAGANVNCRSISGETALHTVCKEYNKFDDDLRKNDANSVELVGTLLMAGANPNLKAEDNKTAFHYAVTRKQPNVEIIQLLIQYGAYISDSDIELDY